MNKNHDGLHAWQILEQNGNDYACAINDYIGRVRQLSGLDEKTFHLIWIAVQTALDYDLAVKAHVPLALSAGATLSEIVGAAAIAGAGAGPKGFVKCFAAIIKEHEKLQEKADLEKSQR
jgi:alkylhydroperoxidase/carboxymuconolactone decarboxylase family protein YurZ